MKYVIDANKKFDGFVYTRMSDDKHSDYGGETVEELQERMPDSTFEVIDDAELDKLIEKYLKEASSDPFEEITEERYWDMLECVLPALQGSNWFFLGEAFNYDIHLFCFTDGKRYFSGHRRISLINEVRTEMQAFLDNLDK